MGKGAGKVRWAVAVLAIVVLTSCAAQFRNHGYAPSEADLANVIVGKDTRDTVAKLIGNPTASGLVDDSAWYYVESRFRNVAFQAPKEIERQVVAISFDARGRVANIERFGLQDGRVIVLARRITRITNDKTPFLRRLLGNIGQAGAGLFN
jgi:outer membrane protein assembly factor BamE (lipoprotein component of BamABCDE complex)